MKKRVNGAWVEKSPPKYGTEADAITSLPTEIKADGTNATAIIKGAMNQASTPSPSSPVYPSECGNKTANLFDGSIEQGNLNENAAIGTSYNDTKSIPSSLTNSYRVRITNPIHIDRELTLSVDFSNYQMYVLFYDENQQYTGEHSSSWRNSSLTLSGEYIGKYVGLAVKSNESGNVPISPTDDIKLMLNTGSTALPYEPYGIKIPILSGGTTTPVYMGEVQSTRQIKKLVLDGTETWNKSSTYQGSFYARVIDNEGTTGNINLYDAICSHAVKAAAINATDYTFGKFGFDGGANPFNLNLFIGEAAWTKDDFKTYLAQQYSNGTPVTVWYVLATETTGIVNEPLRKIGDYVDGVSASNIPTVEGSQTFDVETSLKPSEVDLTYHGWHRKEPKERVNGDWE